MMPRNAEMVALLNEAAFASEQAHNLHHKQMWRTCNHGEACDYLTLAARLAEAARGMVEPVAEAHLVRELRGIIDDIVAERISTAKGVELFLAFTRLRTAADALAGEADAVKVVAAWDDKQGSTIYTTAVLEDGSMWCRDDDQPANAPWRRVAYAINAARAAQGDTV